MTFKLSVTMRWWENLDVMIGLHHLHRCIGLPRFFFSLTPYTVAHVWYDLVACLCTIRSGDFFCWLLYNINFRATHTTIPSTRGVEIHISLVSSATDSIRRCIAVFKTVAILTSDLKSEFLCQSSSSCAEPADSPETPCTPGISPTPSSPRITLTVTVQVLSLST